MTITAAIIAAEIAFWVVLMGGLAARYPLRMPRLGMALLVAVPLVDVALLAVTAVDLAAGARADWTHGLAALYLGASVAFGPGLVRGMDRRFARRFAPGSPEAAAPPAEDRLAAQWRLWRRAAFAAGLASGVLGLLVVTGGPDATHALWQGGGWFAQLAAIAAAWLLLGPGWTAAARHIRFPATPMRREDLP